MLYIIHDRFILQYKISSYYKESISLKACVIVHVELNSVKAQFLYETHE